MFSIEAVPDNEPLLKNSPLICGLLRTAEYIEKNGSIGLTKSGAFNRKFVHWAAANFDWPGYSHEELFRINKVLDEVDFPPVGDIHALLIGLKLARRWKGTFRLTKAGQKLLTRPGLLFSELIPAYLLRLDHSAHLRFDHELMGNWDIFLNVINVEADQACSLAHLRTVLYGAPELGEYRFDEIASTLYITVLRPLCWAGLLQANQTIELSSKAQFFKSELWRCYLRLDTDQHLKPHSLS